LRSRPNSKVKVVLFLENGVHVLRSNRHQ
jgi:hypothetical protein